MMADRADVQRWRLRRQFSRRELAALRRVQATAHWREFGTEENTRLEFARYLYERGVIGADDDDYAGDAAAAAIEEAQQDA